ncbi:MAG: D-alanyl-D-alanine carboxypeptidase family protein [Pseudomonadota bacterium]
MVLRALRFFGVLYVVLCVSVTQQSFANFESSASHAILMDSETNSVLYEKKADELMYPASMSKLMTLALVFREMSSGKLKLDDEIFISVNAWRNGGAPSRTSAMFASVKSKVSLKDILQGIVVQSGNDASIAIAEAMYGSEQAFAEEMTKLARELGLSKSIFSNATGLPSPNHKMTARELAELSIYLIKTYPEYYTYFAQKEFKYKRYRFINRNPLLSQNIGVDGLKTGFVKDAGYGITISAKRGDRRLVAVINGLKSKKERTSEARRLLEWGFRSFKSFRLFNPDETVGYIRVWGGEKTYLPLTGDENGVNIYLPRIGDSRLRASIVYDGPLKTPIKKGQKVASLRIRTQGSTSTQVPLYAAETVKPSGFIWQGIDSLIFLAFGWLYHAI